jgi:hypothetical protein
MEEEPLAFAVPQRSKPEIALGETMETFRGYGFVGLQSGHESSGNRGPVVLSPQDFSSFFFRVRGLALSHGSTGRSRENDFQAENSWVGHFTSKANANTPQRLGWSRPGKAFELLLGRPESRRRRIFDCQPRIQSNPEHRKESRRDD